MILDLHAWLGGLQWRSSSMPYRHRHTCAPFIYIKTSVIRFYYHFCFFQCLSVRRLRRQRDGDGYGVDVVFLSVLCVYIFRGGTTSFSFFLSSCRTQFFCAVWPRFVWIELQIYDMCLILYHPYVGCLGTSNKKEIQETLWDRTWNRSQSYFSTAHTYRPATRERKNTQNYEFLCWSRCWLRKTVRII